MDIRKVIEAHRRKLDLMAKEATDLTELLEEARKMDRLFEVYEARKATVCIRKNA